MFCQVLISDTNYIYRIPGSSFTKISTRNLVKDNQDFERICNGLKVKTYIARANTEKGGMIPDQVMGKIENLNPLIGFQEFDTGHGIRSEMPNEYYDLVNKMLNH